MNVSSRFSKVWGPHGPELMAAMRAGLQFLHDQPPLALLPKVGQVIDLVPSFQAVDKTALQDSYGGSQAGPPDDFLVGRGLFYLSERRRLFLDGTAGHYQMLWGYNPPELCQAMEEAMRLGIIWDNHSNIPQWPVKQLAHRLVSLANAPGEPDPLDTVLLGVCTGSVACAAALKIQLQVYERRQGPSKVPVIITLDGNYHGTDMVPQFMRGLWPHLPKPFEMAILPPNDEEVLEMTFRKYGERVAGFWSEPIMMNREAIAIQPAFLQKARKECDRVGALMCIDEIQTGFWQPQIFDYRTLGIQPDLVVLGKGMTAGLHPHSAVLMKQRHDVLAQYDAISTNGSASLPCYVALCSMQMIEENTASIEQAGERVAAGFKCLVEEFPEILLSAQGRRHLAGLKFRRVEDALAFHQRALEAGIWCRAHAYHAGHSTVLTKLGLLTNEAVVDFVIEKFRGLLRTMKRVK